jgi:hypothetical protein
MLERLMKKLGLMPRTIDKAELEDLLTAMMSEGRDNTLDALKELSKLDEKAFNTKAMNLMYGRLGNARKPQDVIKELIRINENLFKKENDIRSLLVDVPDVITTKHTTAKVASVINMFNDISTFINYQLDFFYLLVFTEGNENEYTDPKLKEMWGAAPSYVSILMFISNIDNELSIINKIDNNIIINEDNKSSRTLLGNTKLNFMPSNDLIQTIYSIRVWLVDREIKKYELLKEKKALLELRVLELKKKLAGDPTDTKILKAIDVYTEKIEETEFRIKKIERL